jgi:hypothetical protein
MVKNIKTALSLVIALFPALFFTEIKQMTANEGGRTRGAESSAVESFGRISILPNRIRMLKLQKLPTLRLLQVSSI